MTLGKVDFSIFDRFLKLLDFLAGFPAKSTQKNSLLVYFLREPTELLGEAQFSNFFLQNFKNHQTGIFPAFAGL